MAAPSEQEFTPSSTHLHTVHDHTDTAKETLLPHLRPHLPYAVTVYRRIQFGHLSSHAHILATIATDAAVRDPSSPSTYTPSIASCFAAAYVDRSRRPETECWLYLPHDHPSHRASTSTSTSTSASTPLCTCTSTHLPSLLAHIATLPYPPLSLAHLADIHASVNAPAFAATAARYHTHTSAPAARYLEDLERPDLLKVGAMHAGGVGVARGRGWLDGDGVGGGFAYRKYIFLRRGAEDDGEGWVPALPKGLRWGRIASDEEIALVRSRTAIPKTHATLRVLPSVAVFPERGRAEGEKVEDEEAQMPVAWAFLAVDGSLSTLHVEPEYRGKGLAKAMGRKLFRDGLVAFGDELDGLAHADVALENKESNGVCKSLGGIDEGWHVYWVRIDLERVKAQLKGLQ
ncbi:hypothetical protein B0J12DRAFT_649330 [Macrophomina phaseolina]|uniref:GCN5-related N-acetyltransferase Rv2170-like domain-containing protein n=1 Tax=Macrophomina phaseolina TaxID=35725 RepID=A0ABQ8GLN5_9PEZI|nr:hypothetical protein B0J12DRAFT_649330 [Macrophomina phaseolina]